MSSTDIFDSVSFAKQIGTYLRTELMAVAEPVLQQALHDMEVEMRKRLAVAVLGMVDRSYDVRRMQDKLVITVNLSAMGKRDE